MKSNNIRLLIFIIGLLFFLSAKPQSNISACEKIRQEWLNKKLFLKQKTDQFPAGIILNHEDLRKIIYPEYTNYDYSINDYEIGLIKLFYHLGVTKFETISIGPFQMQLRFIKTLLENIPDQRIADTTLLMCKKSGYPGLIKNAYKLSKLDAQWKILLLYEDFCITKDILNNSDKLNNVINYYNSGKAEQNKIIFSKIKCEQQTYLYWSTYLSNLK